MGQTSNGGLVHYHHPYEECDSTCPEQLEPGDVCYRCNEWVYEKDFASHWYTEFCEQKQFPF